jgi:hypothetical protein
MQKQTGDFASPKGILTELILSTTTAVIISSVTVSVVGAIAIVLCSVISFDAILIASPIVADVVVSAISIITVFTAVHFTFVALPGPIGNRPGSV